MMTLPASHQSTWESDTGARAAGAPPAPRRAPSAPPAGAGQLARSGDSGRRRAPPADAPLRLLVPPSTGDAQRPPLVRPAAAPPHAVAGRRTAAPPPAPTGLPPPASLPTRARGADRGLAPTPVACSAAAGGATPHPNPPPPPPPPQPPAANSCHLDVNVAPAVARCVLSATAGRSSSHRRPRASRTDSMATPAARVPCARSKKLSSVWAGSLRAVASG